MKKSGRRINLTTARGGPHAGRTHTRVKKSLKKTATRAVRRKLNRDIES